VERHKHKDDDQLGETQPQHKTYFWNHGFRGLVKRMWLPPHSVPFCRGENRWNTPPIAMIERKDGAPAWLAGLLRERDGAEETVGIVTRTGSEEELIGRSVGRGALPELNGPYLVYLDGMASSVSKRPQECARLGI
jgi:hypothetical protein